MAGHVRSALVILNPRQFGYHLDTYYYAKYAGKQLDVRYACFDTGSPRLNLDGVTVTYVRHGGCKPLRYLRLLAVFVREVRRCRGVVFLNYFPGCSLLRCFGPGARMVVDIRTSSIHPNRLIRRCGNGLMRWESRLFRNISVVSEGLAKRLHLPPDKTHVLPLGAESTTTTEKRFDRLDLLYVGTFDGRRIEDTVIGLERFLLDSGGRVPLAYTIIGDGHNGQRERLQHLVRQRGLDRVVHLLGYVHRTELNDLFARCSIGVSYVPINDIYDCQPVTKTFEYLSAGMAVIATATTEHRKVVKRFNGVLIQDTPEGFCRGLQEVYERRHEFDSETIRLCCPESSWERIVHLNFIPYIQSICPSRLTAPRQDDVRDG